jgi:UMF1 family MFS transporter
VASHGTSVTVRNDQRTLFGWAVYDWANSAFAVASGAIVAPFFTGVIVPEGGYSGMSGETLWAWLVAGGTLVLVVVMPVLGAVADSTASKRRFLWFFAWTGAAFTLAVPLVPAGSVALFVALFVVAQIGFTAANVFYDGFLPQITTDETIDSTSARGFAYGYMGGGLFLVLALVLIVLSGDGGVFGISRETAARVAIAGAGLWWVGFSLVALRRLPHAGQVVPLPDRYRGSNPFRAYAALGFRQTWATTRRLRSFPQLMLFVVAFMLYMDGVQTVTNLGGAYAADTLELSSQSIIGGFLLVQLVAFAGALCFGWLADRIGAKRGILLGLVVWIMVTIAAVFLPSGQPLPFFGLLAILGLVLGGVSALSRSLYGSMIPEQASAEFFGFFTVFSKVAAIWGPIIFGIVSSLTGSGRPAILSIVAFFLLGGILLALVDVDTARAGRERWAEILS